MHTATLPRMEPKFRQMVEYRLTHKEGLPRHDAKQAVDGMLDYLATADSGTSPTKLVDQAWHSAILCTQEYHTFCMENFGRFVHHIPLFPNSKKGLSAVASAEAGDCGICRGGCQPCNKN